MALTQRYSVLDAQRLLQQATTIVFSKQGESGRTLYRLYELSAGLSSQEYILSRTLINDIYDVNATLAEINAQLREGDFYIGCADHLTGYDTEVFKRNGYVPAVGARQFAFLYHRVLSKLGPGKRLYRMLTRGKAKRMSKTEILGRLAFAGFYIEEVNTEGRYIYFKVRKDREPLQGYRPTFGPLIRLKRMVKNGRMTKIYKLRTMHPYAEFIQDYVYRENDLAVGGKLKDDFRVSEEGPIFRKYFLDELPMVINLVKGDIKMVGVRPLSEHYFSLYTQEMQKRRLEHKPGLLPPYYSEEKTPTDLAEVMESEQKYFDEYDQAPFKTDVRYFFKIIKNIFFNKLTSK